jgi:hypothetical protein
LLQRRRDPKGASPKTPPKDRRERPGGPSLMTKLLVTRPFGPRRVNPVAATDSSPLSRYRRA